MSFFPPALLNHVLEVQVCDATKAYRITGADCKTSQFIHKIGGQPAVNISNL
jgi:hypothetical protein